MGGKDPDITIGDLRERLRPTLAGWGDLREEFDRLFDRGPADPPMAVVRARRLLEVLVIDRYVALHRLSPPFGGEISRRSLYKMIEDLSAGGAMSAALAASCHAVRLAGNRVVHYTPDRPDERRTADVSPAVAATVLMKIAEVAEGALTDGVGYSVYAGSLPPPLDDMYAEFRSTWAGRLAGRRDGAFPLHEALDLLLRSIAGQVSPAWLDVLACYSGSDRADGRSVLPEALPRAEEAALRRLRNLGLIDHDGPHLIAPRSSRVWAKPAGRFLLALRNRDPFVGAEDLARQVVAGLREIEGDAAALAMLDRLSRDGHLAFGDVPTARRLRNLYLVAHTTELLVEAKSVTLTDLGFYVLGRCQPDFGPLRPRPGK